jgi:TRAP-type mannitol/chloroaromatic compound transport system substrate-binding protein
MKKKVTRREVLKAGVVAAAAVGASTVVAKRAVAKSKKITWRMQTHWPTGVGYYKPIYQGFAKRVEEATNGEIRIKTLPPGAIVPTKDVFEAVGRGLFEIALLWPSYWIGKVPVAGHLNGQLFTWDSFEEMWFFMTEMGALDIIRQAYADHGLFVVGPISAGPLCLYSKKPLIKPADFQGFKVRSTGIPSVVFQKMGATPVYFPGSELYQALQTGVCDGAHWGGVAAAWEMKFQEVTDYIIQPNLAMQTLGEIFVNKKIWDGLPADLKRILLDCCLATNADSNAWFRYRDFEDMELFKSQYKGKIIQMEPQTVAMMRAFSVDVIDEYSKKDPKYCGKVGALMHKFLTMTGKI